MDAGNSSGSMQSSSGGDEEYDSRAESNVRGFLYGPSPIFGDAFSQSPSNALPNSSFLNLDAFRPEGLRSDLGNNLLAGSSSSSTSAPSSSSQSIIAAAHQGPIQGPLSSAQLGSADDNGAQSSQPSDQTHHGVAPRNPKKRTRASRRAPTTVLTTDTSNFRAMVQEFTGFPAPPFSCSPYSRRLDLFGSGSSLRSGHLEPLGSSVCPLRPSARRVHPQTPFITSNNNNTISLTASFSVTTTSSSNPTSINYHLPSDLGGPPNKQSQDMINMQNQMLSFQSPLQPQPFHSSFHMPAGMGAKSTTSLPLPLPSFDELGMNLGDANPSLGGLPSHMTTEETIMRLRNDIMWRDDGSEQDQHLRPFDGNYV